MRYSDLEVMSQYSSIFNQIFNEELKIYKLFYDLTTWSRRGWDNTLDCIFNDFIDALKDKLPCQKRIKIRLLRSAFRRALTPQSILEHFSYCKN